MAQANIRLRARLNDESVERTLDELDREFGLATARRFYAQSLRYVVQPLVKDMRAATPVLSDRKQEAKLRRRFPEYRRGSFRRSIRARVGQISRRDAYRAGLPQGGQRPMRVDVGFFHRLYFIALGLEAGNRNLREARMIRDTFDRAQGTLIDQLRDRLLERLEFFRQKQRQRDGGNR